MSARVKSVLAALLLAGVCAVAASAAEWRQKKTWNDNYGGSLEITATYYAAEYIEQAVQEQAKKNLWTADEMEDYRYNLLQQLKLDDMIPVFIKINLRGPALHMAPFERHIYLWIGKHRVNPVDYDRRFNFKITDAREGFVYFPRFDEKGKPYLTPKVKQIKLEFDGGVHPVTIGKDVSFYWNVRDDNPDKILRGKSGAKLEMDRLTKRMSNLSKEGKELQDKLTQIEDEMRTINTRMMELQSQINN